MKNVLLTGATGFVGRALYPALRGADVRCAAPWKRAQPA
jgi:nucleoside-diphosphate-sugar epimerase